MPTKTFVAGEVLTASDVNTYLRNGNFTDKRIPFSNGSGVLVDSANFAWDDSANKLELGSASKVRFGGDTEIHRAGAGIVGVNELELTTTLRWLSSAVRSTTATAGTASALPALPSGYITQRMDGANIKVPYYAP